MQPKDFMEEDSLAREEHDLASYLPIEVRRHDNVIDALGRIEGVVRKLEERFPEPVLELKEGEYELIEDIKEPVLELKEGEYELIEDKVKQEIVLELKEGEDYELIKEPRKPREYKADKAAAHLPVPLIPEPKDCYVLLKDKAYAVDLYRIIDRIFAKEIIVRLDKAREYCGDAVLVADLQEYLGDPVKVLKDKYDDVDFKLAKIDKGKIKKLDKDKFMASSILNEIERHIRKLKRWGYVK